MSLKQLHWQSNCQNDMTFINLSNKRTFLCYKWNWKRILNKSQSDHSDISHILTYFLCDGLGSTHKKWYWNPTGLSPSQRTMSFQFFFKCPTEFKIWSHQILNKKVWCIFIKLQYLTFVPFKNATMHSYATCFSPLVETFPIGNIILGLIWWLWDRVI